MFHKTKNEKKKNFYVLVVSMCWQNIEKFVWLFDINGSQSVRLEKGKRTIKFKNCFTQMPVPFKIYADFKCYLESVESYEGSYSKKYQDHISCSFAYKLLCVGDKFTKPVVVFRGENGAYEFFKGILKEYWYCKK